MTTLKTMRSFALLASLAFVAAVAAHEDDASRSIGDGSIPHGDEQQSWLDTLPRTGADAPRRASRSSDAAGIGTDGVPFDRSLPGVGVDAPGGSGAAADGAPVGDALPGWGDAYEGDLEIDDCAADLNHDGNVDFDDLVKVLRQWGSCIERERNQETGEIIEIRRSCEADLDDSSTVDFDDLVAVLGAWGRCR